jgi:hypothetical protein
MKTCVGKLTPCEKPQEKRVELAPSFIVHYNNPNIQSLNIYRNIA